jgi:nitrate reductase gamma subunit
MHALCRFISGPLAWVAFGLFFGGLLFQLTRTLWLVRQKEPFIFTYMSLRYSLRSLAHWLTPFGSLGWRQRPVLTVVTFLFHISLVVTPIFALGHIVLWEESWNISWWGLPDGLTDALTVIVCAGCIFFAVRRRILPEVRFVTDASDFLLLALTAAPFVTGFLAYHQWTAGPWMTLAHMLSGEILLAAIPFTRLSHMLFGWLTRSYMGSEFGGVRHARDW